MVKMLKVVVEIPASDLSFAATNDGWNLISAERIEDSFEVISIKSDIQKELDLGLSQREVINRKKRMRSRRCTKITPEIFAKLKAGQKMGYGRSTLERVRVSNSLTEYKQLCLKYKLNSKRKRNVRDN